MSVHSRDFEKAFSNAQWTFDYDPSWANGTGYFDHLVDAEVGLDVGQMANFCDDHQRRGLIIRTVFGNVVVFERYVRREDQEYLVVVTNCPQELRWLLEGSLNEQTFNLAVGLYCENIGVRLQKLYSAMKDADPTHI